MTQRRQTFVLANLRCFLGLYSGKKCFFLFFLLLFSASGFSQLTIDTTLTNQQYVEDIVGPGFIISNVKSNCYTGAIGSFTSTAVSDIGLLKGIVLTTGMAALVKGPNNKVNAGYNQGRSGDSKLDELTGAVTFDGCALEFDLIPSCDTLRIKYVFGSEEYPEYVNRTFNDVFGFFVTGPGITASKNIAAVPGTTTPVSIGSINSIKNKQYFKDNTNGQKIQYDGYTTPLTAVQAVIPCSTYHVKLVIADAGDGIFDSGVFIEGNSIKCSPAVYNEIATNVNPVINCKNGSFDFCRTGDISAPYVVNYTVGGTAVNGTDYQLLPGTVTIPAGQKCTTVAVIPTPYTTPQPDKTIIITYSFGFCPEPNHFTMILSYPESMNAGSDVYICSGDSAKMGCVRKDNTNYLWVPTTGLSDPKSSNPTISLVNNTASSIKYTYVLTASSTTSACILVDTVFVTVSPHPKANFYIKDSSVHCLGNTTYFNDTSSAINGNSIKSWYWDFGNYLFDTLKNTSTTYAIAGIYKVTLTITDDKGCSADTSLKVEISPIPKADFKFLNACIGDSVSFYTLPDAGGAIVSQALWNFGDSPDYIDALNPKHIYTGVAKTYSVQLIVKSNKNCIGTKTKMLELYPKPSVSFEAPSGCALKSLKFNNFSDGNLSFWNFGDGTTITDRNPIHKYNSAGAKTVKLIVSNNYGCKDSMTKSLSIFKLPVFDFVATDTAGCPVFLTNFMGNAIAGSDSIVTWKWIFNPASIKFGKTVIGAPFEEEGNYSPTLVATSINGCADTVQKKYYIHVYPVPKPDFIISPGVLSTYEPKALIIDQSSADVVKWEWDLGDGIKELNKTKFYHEYKDLNRANYTVNLKTTNQYGCFASTFRRIGLVSERTVFIPNAFTPNGDKINDLFMPYASGDLLNANFRMYVFDRWGIKVLFSGDLNQGWNGSFKGEVCERDVYVYTVVFTNKEDGSVLAKFKGTVTLIQ